MAVPQTKLHANRVLEQIMDNVVGLQRDMVNNATAHKAMAQAQSPDLATLQGFVNDSIAAYSTRLGWGDAIVNTPAKLTILTNTCTRIGLAVTDITDITNALKTVVTTMQGANKTTYAQIVSLCDTVITAVNLPDSLWPE